MGLTRATDGRGRANPSLPAVVTPEHDVNPVCGHWLGNQCDGCGTCTTCDGCYCGALRHENGLDALPHQADHPDTL